MALTRNKKCQVCLSTFLAKRGDAKTCSATCRKRLQRILRTRIKEEVVSIESTVNKEFHRLASLLLSKHLVFEPLVISDETGSIPTASVPIPVKVKTNEKPSENPVIYPAPKNVGAANQIAEPIVNEPINNLQPSAVQSPVDLFKLEPTGQDQPDPQTTDYPYKNSKGGVVYGFLIRLSRRWMIAGLALLLLLLIGFSSFVIFGSQGRERGGNTPQSLASSDSSEGFSVSDDQKLYVNLPLQANKTVIIAPTEKPANLEKGQIFFDQASDQLFYYDGKKLHNLGASSRVVNNTIQGPTNITNSTVINSVIQSGVMKLTGTSGQVNVSSSTGNVTLSLPQSVSTSSTPTFAGLNLGSALQVSSGGTGATSFADNSLLLGNGTGAIQTTNVGTSGQCLIVNGSGVPTFQGCSAGGGVFAGGSQTPGTLTKFDTTTNQIVDSLVSESGGTVTVGGDLTVTGVASGDGSGLTNLDASNLASGTVASARLSGSYTGITGVGNLDTGSIISGFGSISTGNNITTTATIQGGIVNATSVFQLNGVNINTAGTLSNVAYLNQDQTFTGHNIFKSSSDSATAFQIQDNLGTSNLFVADTINNRIGIGTLGPGYSLDVQSGDINTSGIYRVNGAQISSANLSNDSNLAKINGTNVFTAANTFSSTVAIQGANSLTLGTASNVGSIIFRDGASANTATLQVAGALSGDVTFGLPVTTGTQTICTVEAGNCAGSGSGVTTSGGTPGRLAVFTGSQDLGDSSITDDGSTVTVTVGQVIQGSAGLTIGDTGVNGQLAFKNSSNSNTLTLQSGVTTSDLTLILPTGDGAPGDCLQTNGSGVLAFSACTGGAGGGVTSVNTLTGVLNLVGTTNQVDVSSAGDTITLSLPQDINTSGNANFRTITLTGQVAGDNLIVGNAVSGATGTLLDLKVNNVSKLTVDASGNVNTTGQYQVNGSQISSADLSNDSNLAKLDGTGPQVFTGDNEFTGTVLTQLDSVAAFQIQNGAGTSNLLVADTTTTRIGIGTATPGYTLDVNGDINTSGVYRINGVTVCSASGCTAASGSGDYIQNGTAPQVADFNVTGTGRTGGIFTAGAGGKTAITISDSGAQNSGLTIGGDTNLYRSSAGVLKTDGQLYATGLGIFNQAGGAAETIVGYNCSTGMAAFCLGGDTNLYRPSASVLQTDGKFIAGNLTGSPNTTLSVYNSNESTTQTDFTQALTKGGINIVTDFTDTSYTPGIFWSTQDNNATKPKAGIYMYEDSASGTSLLFGTSGAYATGITNTALTLNAKGGAIFKNGTNDTTGFQVQNATGTGLFTVNTSTGAALTTTLFIDTLGSGGTTALCWNGSSQVSTCSGTGAPFIQGGNSFAGTAILGTNDNNNLAFETNNTTRWLIDTSGNFIPNVNDTYNIGSDTARVANLYLGGETLHIGSSTSDEGTISYNNTSDSLIFKNATNSTTAFQLQDKDANVLLAADTTTNKRVNIVGDVNVGSRYGNRLFSDNFESNSFNLWDQGTGGAISLDTATVHAGKYAAKINPAGAAAFADATISANSTTYMRAWVNVTSQTSGNADIFTLYYDGTHYWTLYRNGGAVHIYNGVINADAGSGGSFTTGTWHLLEMRITTGAGTGTSQAWLDGTLVVNATSQNNGTDNPDIVEIGDSNSRTFTAYIDDVTLDTATTGTASSLNVDDSFHSGGSGSFGGPVLIQSTSSAPDLSIQASTGNGATARINADDNNIASLQLMETNDRGFNLFYDGDPNEFVLQANDGGTLSNVFTAQRTDGSVVFQNSNDSTTAFQIQDENANPILYVDTTNAAVRIKGTGANGGGGRLQFGDGDLTGSQNVWVGEHDTGDTDQLQLQGATGVYITGQYDGSVEIANFFSDTTGIYGTGVNALAVAQFNSRAVFGYDGSTQDAIVQGNSGKGFRLYTDGNDSTTRSTFSVNTDGAALFQNYNDTAAAFDIQNTSNQSLFKVDSSSNNIIIGGNNSGALQSWQTNTNALPAARQNATTVTANGYIYVIGGSTAASSTSTCGTALTTASYAKLNADGSTGSWGSTTALPNPRCGATSVAANGYVYVIGGVDNAPATNSTVYYARMNSDGTLGSWNTNSNALPAVKDGSTSAIANGYIYVIDGEGGWNGSGGNNLYYAKLNADGSTGSWTNTTGPRDSLWASAVTANGYLYVIGGYASETEVDYAQLNPTTGAPGTWNTTTSLPAGRWSATTVIANGYMYVLSGFGGSYLGNAVSSVYYAPLNSDGTVGSWVTDANTMPTSQGFATSVIANGYIYEIGGESYGAGSGTVQSTVYYSSTQRVKIGGSLDLVGLGAGNGLDGGSIGQGSTGGNLTAGDTRIMGSLQVQGQVSLSSSLSVGGTITANGNATFQPNTDSTTALKVQNSTGTSLFIADTSNSRIYIGNPTADSTGAILVLDNKNTSGDPSGVDGGMYFNSATNSFRCYQNSAWQSCGAQTKALTADQSSSSSTLGNVTNMTFSVAANTDYAISCNVVYTSASTTNGIKLAFNGPASPTSVIGDWESYDATVTSFQGIIFRVYDFNTATSNVDTANTSVPSYLKATIRNGANAGTLALRFASENGGTSVTVKTGTNCSLTQL